MVVGRGCDVEAAKEIVRERLYYAYIVDFRWIQECEKRFDLVNMTPFNLENRQCKLEEVSPKIEVHEMNGMG